MRRPSVFLVFAVAVAMTGCLAAPSDDNGADTGATARAAAKVSICHIPPGDPGDAHTITVPQSAVAAHLAHGDSTGACVCPPGEQWTCYSGPAGTDGVGACQSGVKTCNADAQGYSACVGEVVPVAESCDDGIDNDCDGVVDENCVCAVGSTTACYSGPAGTAGVGVCRAGEQVCADGSGYGACTGDVLPSAEVCGDGLDNDCDGVTDEGCVCAPGSAVACYDGPAGTAGVGACAAGTRTCDADGNGYGACVGAITPTAEVCGDGLDNDCDGVADDGCVCAPGSAVACYRGPAGTEGVGVCTAGAQFCNDDGTAYDACVGSIEPSADVCGDAVDNDCDGAADEGCVCAPGSASACYEGPPGTDGIGICRTGVQLCNAQGTEYGACIGAIEPLPEVCGDGLDNNCDGYTDDGCVCVPDSAASCYDGPAGTEGIGECHAGAQECNSIGTGYGACVGAVEPVAEVCGDRVDNDCDGSADDGCGCVPSAEVCGDGVDNDCDGVVDENCLGDRAWNDRDRNGIQDAGESGLAGATMLLRTSSGALVAVTTSNAAGAYWFSNVPPGSYYMEVIPPFGYSLSNADAGADDTRDHDFDAETGATTIFTFTGTTGKWDAGFYAINQI